MATHIDSGEIRIVVREMTRKAVLDMSAAALSGIDLTKEDTQNADIINALAATDDMIVIGAISAIRALKDGTDRLAVPGETLLTASGDPVVIPEKITSDWLNELPASFFHPISQAAHDLNQYVVDFFRARVAHPNEHSRTQRALVRQWTVIRNKRKKTGIQADEDDWKPLYPVWETGRLADIMQAFDFHYTPMQIIQTEDAYPGLWNDLMLHFWYRELTEDKK